MRLSGTETASISDSADARRHGGMCLPSYVSAVQNGLGLTRLRQAPGLLPAPSSPPASIPRKAEQTAGRLPPCPSGADGEEKYEGRRLGSQERFHAAVLSARVRRRLKMELKRRKVSDTERKYSTGGGSGLGHTRARRLKVSSRK